MARHKSTQAAMLPHIVQIQRLGYAKIAGEFRDCHENALAKGFETSPHSIKLALSLKILMALANCHWDRAIGP